MQFMQLMHNQGAVLHPPCLIWALPHNQDFKEPPPAKAVRPRSQNYSFCSLFVNALQSWAYVTSDRVIATHVVTNG